MHGVVVQIIYSKIMRGIALPLYLHVMPDSNVCSKKYELDEGAGQAWEHKNSRATEHEASRARW